MCRYFTEWSQACEREQEDIPVGMKRLPLNRSAEFVSQLPVAHHTRTFAVARCRISEHHFTSTKDPDLRVWFFPTTYFGRVKKRAVCGFVDFLRRFIWIDMEKREINLLKWLKDWTGSVSQWTSAGQRSLVCIPVSSSFRRGKRLFVLALAWSQLGLCWKPEPVFRCYTAFNCQRNVDTLEQLGIRAYLCNPSPVSGFLCCQHVKLIMLNFIARLWNLIAAFEQSPHARWYCKTKAVCKAQLLVWCNVTQVHVNTLIVLGFFLAL